MLLKKSVVYLSVMVACLSGAASIAPAQDPAEEVYRPGNGISSPVPITQPKPKYPRAAMDAKIEGVVLLECVVRADGTVGDISVLRSLDKEFGLDDAAVAAATLWTFQPGIRQRDKKPVAVRVTIEMAFTLKK
jgi:TonB family protein